MAKEISIKYPNGKYVKIKPDIFTQVEYEGEQLYVIKGSGKIAALTMDENGNFVKVVLPNRLSYAKLDFLALKSLITRQVNGKKLEDCLLSVDILPSVIEKSIEYRKESHKLNIATPSNGPDDPSNSTSYYDFNQQSPPEQNNPIPYYNVRKTSSLQTASASPPLPPPVPPRNYNEQTYAKKERTPKQDHYLFVPISISGTDEPKNRKAFRAIGSTLDSNGNIEVHYEQIDKLPYGVLEELKKGMPSKKTEITIQKLHLSSKELDEIKTNGTLRLMPDATPRTEVEEEHYHISFLPTFNYELLSDVNASKRISVISGYDGEKMTQEKYRDFFRLGMLEKEILITENKTFIPDGIALGKTK